MMGVTTRRILGLASLVILPIVVSAQSISSEDLATIERMRAEKSAAGSSGSRGVTGEGVRSSVMDRSGEVDPNESTLPPDSTRKKLRLQNASLQDSAIRDSLSGLERYGRSIFKKADPSMFASHAGAVGGGYLLGPGDEIILTMWGQKEGRYQLVLDREGQIHLEGVGVVSLNGQSLASASDILRKRLNRIYAGIGAGQMDLTLGKLKQVRIFVVGHVEQPGSFLLSGNTSILAAVYQAKGPTEIGSEREVEIVRGKTRTKADLYDFLFRGQSGSQTLQDGDVVLVPPHGPLVQIKGDVGRPAVYELLASEGAKELLGYAGGIRSTAATTNMLVQRIFENGRRDVLTLPSPTSVLSGPPAPLRDGDVVQVFRGNDPALSTVAIVGRVRFPGSYPIGEGMRASDLIKLSGGPTKDAFEGRVILSRLLVGKLRSFQRFSILQADTSLLQNGDSLFVFDRTELALHDSVRISGAVRRPGYYPWREGMTAKDLILMSGGGIWGAEMSQLRLETPRNGAPSLIDVFQIDSGLTNGKADRVLSPKAHLAVPLNPLAHSLDLVQVKGWVVQPGVYALEGNGERLSSLWKRIGGLREDAYLSGASFLRMTDSTYSRIQIDFTKALAEPGSTNDLALHPGDSIFVPARPATVSVKGRVNSPANILWREGKSWRWYIQQAGGFSDSADGDRVYVRYADGTIQTRDNGISDSPTPGSEVIVPFRVPPKPTTVTEMLSAVNLILGTVIAGLTIYVLTQTNK
ncbi:MAG: SLBB domain-containing protein [Fibrobacterota bacterium]|nr:MAG: SLBB domain-containing protein [Fibrobacterota bacterium]